MLAYVFVHRPAPGIDAAEYLARLRSFHSALRSHAPEGFLRSWVWRLTGTPLGEALEDWYLVEDWAALGRLNEAAVSGPRQAPHDAVAPLAGPGAGAVYALIHGTPAAGGHRLRLTKPADVSYQEFEERLRRQPGAAVVWKRQMVLGPDREFLIDTDRAGVMSGALAGIHEPLELIYPS